MIELIDPVQRNIHAIAVRDAIVPDDASDMAAVADAPPKRIQRLLRAMLPGVDVPLTDGAAFLDDPIGRRVGRVAFNIPIQAQWLGDTWTGTGPAPHRLPEDGAAIRRFIRQQTLLGSADPDDEAFDDQIERLLGFGIGDHARISETLRENGPAARLFIATSMLAAACARYEKKRAKAETTGRDHAAASIAAISVEAALTGTARIAADILLSNSSTLFGMHRVAMQLASKVEAFRRTRTHKSVVQAVRMAATTANAVHLFLTRGTIHDIPLEHDRDPERLPRRLATGNAAAEDSVQAMLDDVAAVDASDLYLLLMARRLDVALARHPWLAAPHPIFRLNYAYIGGHALFAEFERLGAIVRTMADRQRLTDGTALNNMAIRPVLATAAATSVAVGSHTPAGRYLDLGAYHRAVTTKFIREKARWLSGTVPHYTHRAYAEGARFCDLAAASIDPSTHDFIRRSELDKPTEFSLKKQDLVLFYGLNVEDTIILAVRQILDRLNLGSVDGQAWRIAFGRTVHRILSHVAPSIAARLEMSSSLKADAATCKGIRNRAIELAKRFSDRDYDRPSGAFFDYALWFDRDRDVAFWDRLQRGAKLYNAFGSTYVSASAEREALPGRQGRRPTPVNAPPSRWEHIMKEAKKAFDAYLPTYLKSRPSLLTARIMARMNQGYSALASDPQFKTIFKV
ncbi:MAG: hypothetical protein ABIV36_26040 [Sphingobium limneticum]|jgi:hypothetical protein